MRFSYFIILFEIMILPSTFWSDWTFHIRLSQRSFSPFAVNQRKCATFYRNIVCAIRPKSASVVAKFHQRVFLDAFIIVQGSTLLSCCVKELISVDRCSIFADSKIYADNGKVSFHLHIFANLEKSMDFALVFGFEWEYSSILPINSHFLLSEELVFLKTETSRK